MKNNDLKYFTFSDIPCFHRSIQQLDSYIYQNKKNNINTIQQISSYIYSNKMHDVIIVQSYYNSLYIDKEYRDFLNIFKQSPGSIIGLKNSLVLVLLKNIKNTLDKKIFLILLSKNKNYNLITRAKIIGIIIKKSLNTIQYLRFKIALRLIKIKIANYHKILIKQ